MEVFADIVDHLRTDRIAGASIAQLVVDLEGQGLELPQINAHFAEAFGLSRRPNLEFVARTESGELDRDYLDNAIGQKVDENRKVWVAAPPYPGLHRRRDREAFKSLAKRTGNILIVCAAHPSAGQHVGRPGYEPAPLGLLGVPRTTDPGRGLLAADPEAPELQGLLSADRSASYDDYVKSLVKRGYSIGSPADGFVIRDFHGTAFYPGYRLHGAYDLETGANAWTSPQGERMRAELNRRMGVELVQHGPLDIAEWVHSEVIDPARRPQPPALFFLPDGDVCVCHDAETMERYYRYYGIDWDRLYPARETQVEERA